MAKLENITVMIQTRYVFVIFPFATYKRTEEFGILTVFGIPIYRRVGDVRCLLGFKYVARCSCANCKMLDGYAPCARRP